MAGDTYRAPAFMGTHAAQQAGSSALSFQESVSGSTPKTAAMDRMGQLPVNWIAAGDKEIRLDRGTGLFEPVNRFVLLPGHSLTGRRIIFEADAGGSPWTGSQVALVPYTVARGSTQYLDDYVGCGVRPGLNVWDFPDIGYRHLRTRLVDGHPSNVPAIAEWWWGRRVVPTYGPRGYEASEFFRGSVLRLPSGVRTSHSYGPMGRSWTMDLSSLSGADYRLFEQLVAGLGVTRDPFLFDPPQPYEVLLAALETTSGLTAVNCSFLTSSTVKVRGTDAAYMISSSGTGVAANIPVPAAYKDLRRAQVGLFVRCDNITYLSATDGLRIRLADATGLRWAEWNFGTNTIKSADTYYQLWVDTDTTPSAVGSPLDLADVAYVVLSLPSPGLLEAVYFQDLKALWKDRAPALVELSEEFDHPQVSGNPQGAGLSYRPRLILREVAA